MVNAVETTPVESTSLLAKMLNTFVSPAEVFDEVIAAPRQSAAWILPTLAVSLASVFLLMVCSSAQQTTTATEHLAEPVSLGDTAAPNENWLGVSLLVVCAAGIGTFWSATILWGIARLFLKAPVSFSKALEIAGLTAMILFLGTIVTALLILASGDASARPALALFAPRLGQDSPIRAFLEVWNFFHIWTAAVLAIGLSRLAKVTFKEAAFWIVGYWFGLRICLILLS